MKASIHVTNELRPCLIKVYRGTGRQTKIEEKKAFFHKFITRAQPIAPAVMRGGHNGGQVIAPYALVELENGQMYEVETQDVRFLDTHELMARYAWGDRGIAKNCETCKYSKIPVTADPCCKCDVEHNNPDQWEAEE